MNDYIKIEKIDTLLDENSFTPYISVKLRFYPELAQDNVNLGKLDSDDISLEIGNKILQKIKEGK